MQPHFDETRPLSAMPLADALAPERTQDPLPPAPAAPHLDIQQWIVAGLRAAFCLPTHIGHATPSPLQLFWLITGSAAAQIGMARLEIPGDAAFEVMGWIYPLCTSGFVLFLVWACLNPRGTATLSHPAPVPAWWALWTVASVAIGAVSSALSALATRSLLPDWWSQGAWLAWLIYGLIWVWITFVAWRVTAALTASRRSQIALIVGLLLISNFASQQIESRPWRPTFAEQDADAASNREFLTLSQEVFTEQQALLADTLAAVQPRHVGRTNVFGLVYAPYAQSVFVRESAMVAGVLQERFGAQGHVVQLVNHPSVTDSLPWATNQNLRASLQALATQMDTEHDVLVLYLSSHGGADFKLATRHWPLDVPVLTPQMLRSMLDEVRIRNRVIAVSACYAGGWIAPLQSDNTLVMTAADATHTSYGCGSKSPLTYFGRALFDEQLRKTYSFEEAFTAAVPIIQQREIEGKKTDGFSNPQIAVGKDIRLVLLGLEQERKLAN